MKKLITTSLIGGFAVVLPVAILLGVFTWVFTFVSKMVHPISNVLFFKSQTLSDIISMIIVVTACFFIGVLVKTKFGKFFHGIVEANLLTKIPLYTLIKETVLQFVGSKKSPFSSVALCNIFQNDTLVTGFITDDRANQTPKRMNYTYTVFIPTGPNPTSGNIYHLNSQYVHPIDISVEDAMRSIISCGAGSDKLIKKINK